MLVIRDRDELKRHLVRQKESYEAQLKHKPTKVIESHVRGMVYGITVAIEAIEAWESRGE